jgi:DNA-binding CsgD family transcriptional regulator
MKSIVDYGLTDAELKVATRMLEFKTNFEIALELPIAEVSVKYHITSIYKKLGVSGRQEFYRLFYVPLPIAEILKDCQANAYDETSESKAQH